MAPSYNLHVLYVQRPPRTVLRACPLSPTQARSDTAGGGSAARGKREEGESLNPRRAPSTNNKEERACYSPRRARRCVRGRGMGGPGSAQSWRRELHAEPDSRGSLAPPPRTRAPPAAAAASRQRSSPRRRGGAASWAERAGRGSAGGRPWEGFWGGRLGRAPRSAVRPGERDAPCPAGPHRSLKEPVSELGRFAVAGGRTGQRPRGNIWDWANFCGRERGASAAGKRVSLTGRSWSNKSDGLSPLVSQVLLGI